MESSVVGGYLLLREPRRKGHKHRRWRAAQDKSLATSLANLETKLLSLHGLWVPIYKLLLVTVSALELRGRLSYEESTNQTSADIVTVGFSPEPVYPPPSPSRALSQKGFHVVSLCLK